jgi:hypothetical protein
MGVERTRTKRRPGDHGTGASDAVDDPVLWAETAGTPHSEDEEVSTSSAPLTKTYGGDGMRLYDQVILRAVAEAQTSARPTNRPTKKERGCARHTKPEGVGLESPLGYKTQREARYHHPPTRQVVCRTKRLRRLTTQRKLLGGFLHMAVVACPSPIGKLV